MSQGSRAVLYNFCTSSCSYRVRIGLNLKKIPYTYVPVNLRTGAQFESSYANKMNPMKQVPTLLIDNLTLTQSSAILEYLEETRKDEGVRLLPDDPIKRVEIRQICQIINSGIQPVQNSRVRKKISDIVDTNSDDKDDNDIFIKSDWAKMIISEGFDALEMVLKNSSQQGLYCVGNNVTMADLFLVPQVNNAYRFDVDMTKYPTIDAIFNHCCKIKEFEDAHPDNQPDSPKLQQGNANGNKQTSKL